MNRRLVGLSVLCLPLLVACASAGDVNQVASELSVEERSAREGIDFAYMERQNRIAQRRGFLIKWINPPRYRPAPASPAPADDAD